MKDYTENVVSSSGTPKSERARRKNVRGTTGRKRNTDVLPASESCESLMRLLEGCGEESKEVAKEVESVRGDVAGSDENVKGAKTVESGDSIKGDAKADALRAADQNTVKDTVKDTVKPHTLSCPCGHIVKQTGLKNGVKIFSVSCRCGKYVEAETFEECMQKAFEVWL